MSNLPINWQDKENSPELQAYLAQFGRQFYIDADEANQVRDAINELAEGTFPDAVLKTGRISISLGIASIAANDFAWRLNQIIYNTPQAYSVAINNATPGYYRNDIIVGDDSGSYRKIEGNSSLTEAVDPPTPAGTIKLGSISIFGATIGTPITPSEGYQTKTEKSPIYIQGGGGGNINVNDDRGYYEIEAYGSPLISLEDQQGFIYPGKEITFRNIGTQNLVFQNDDVTTEMNKLFFTFPGNDIFILKPKETIVFKKTNNSKLAYVGVVYDDQIEVGTNQNVNDLWNGKTVLFTANCVITVPNTLLVKYGFVFRTLAGVTVTWAITAPFAWETTPSTTPEKTTGHFMRRGSTNTILLDF